MADVASAVSLSQEEADVRAAPQPRPARRGLTRLIARRPGNWQVAAATNGSALPEGAEEVSERVLLTAPDHADWIPPAAVLGLQLLVAIVVGVSPLVILLVAVTTTCVMLAVLRARRIAPRRGQVAGIHFSERLIVPLAGASAGEHGTQPALNSGPTTPSNGQVNGGSGPPGNGRPAEERRVSLDWVAASIHPGARKPNDSQPPNER